MPASTTSVLKDLLGELRNWRGSPSRRELLNQRSTEPEKLDPTPVELPVGYESPPTMQQLIQQYVRLEVSQAAQEAGLGTFEEEDDFEVDDPDALSLSAYELHEYQLDDDLEMPPIEDAAPPVDKSEGSEATAEAPQEPSEAPSTASN